MIHKTIFDATLLPQWSAKVCHERQFLTQHAKFKHNIAGFWITFKNLQQVATMRYCVKSCTVWHVKRHWSLLQHCCIKTCPVGHFHLPKNKIYLPWAIRSGFFLPCVKRDIFNGISTSYNLLTSRPEVMASTSAADASKLLTASSRNSFSGDVLGWHWNTPDVVTSIMPSTLCDPPEPVRVCEGSGGSSLMMLSTVSECWNMAMSFSPGGSTNVWIILDSVFCWEIIK